MNNYMAAPIGQLYNGASYAADQAPPEPATVLAKEGKLGQEKMPAYLFNFMNKVLTANANKIDSLFTDIYTEMKNMFALVNTNHTQLRDYLRSIITTALTNLSTSKAIFTNVAGNIVSGTSLGTLLGVEVRMQGNGSTTSGYAQRSHASTVVTYGAGTDAVYGHVRGGVAVGPITINCTAGVVSRAIADGSPTTLSTTYALRTVSGAPAWAALDGR